MKKMQSLGFMGAVLVFAVLSSFGIAEASNSNPLIRNCRPEGYLWSVHSSRVGELPLCLFAEAGIGAQDILDFKSEKIESQAIRLFLSLPQSNNGEGTCLKQTGEMLDAVDSNGKVWKVCQLPDGSIIELDTLARGSAHAGNKILRDLLLSR